MDVTYNALSVSKINMYVLLDLKKKFVLFFIEFAFDNNILNFRSKSDLKKILFDKKTNLFEF